MKCPNKSRYLIVIGLLGLFVWAIASSAQSSEQSAGVGYVSLTTAQQAQKEGDADSFAPSLLVRFARTDGSGGRVFAMTDRSGTAVVPLEPGTYCATAYGLDGNPAALSARSAESIHRCFSIEAATTIEFSVTLAPGVTYVKSIPPLGAGALKLNHESGHALASARP